MTSVDEFLKDTFLWTDIIVLNKAMKFSEKAHCGQLRDEGTPYFEHIKGVINILTNEFDVQSDTALSVAALHDVLEDSDLYTYNDLCNEFGNILADGVLLLSKKPGQGIDEYLRDIYDAPGMSWLMLVKLSDRLHNLRSLRLTNNPDKIKRKCKETRDYFMKYASKYPVAEKLINKELSKLEASYGK